MSRQVGHCADQALEYRRRELEASLRKRGKLRGWKPLRSHPLVKCDAFLPLIGRYNGKYFELGIAQACEKGTGAGVCHMLAFTY
jgi:hypothetical protein